MRIILVILFVYAISSCSFDKSVKVEWVDNLQEDFSFADKWSYAENVFKNNFAQLVCDAICDPRLDAMRDKDGRIIEDSISLYYQLLDTTHYYHSHTGEASCYEWVGTDFAHAKKVGDTVFCYTECNVATHSSLQLKILKDKCFAQIVLNSITNTGNAVFTCKGGYIKIDKSSWNKGILKTEFNLDFIDSDNVDIPMWWQGRILTKIE